MLLPNYLLALVPEENLKSPTEAEGGDALNLSPGSSHEASSPEVHFTEIEREDSSSTEMECSIDHHLLHEDEQDFKVRVRGTECSLGCP